MRPWDGGATPFTYRWVCQAILPCLLHTLKQAAGVIKVSILEGEGITVKQKQKQKRKKQKKVARRVEKNISRHCGYNVCSRRNATLAIHKHTKSTEQFNAVQCLRCERLCTDEVVQNSSHRGVVGAVQELRNHWVVEQRAALLQLREPCLVQCLKRKCDQKRNKFDVLPMVGCQSASPSPSIPRSNCQYSTVQTACIVNRMNSYAMLCYAKGCVPPRALKDLCTSWDL